MESVLLDPETWKGIEVEETELKLTGPIRSGPGSW